MKPQLVQLNLVKDGFSAKACAMYRESGEALELFDPWLFMDKLERDCVRGIGR